jgi:catechol 2,3-dioxygenase-like lactoylglutathione lyase family enzyme
MHVQSCIPVIPSADLERSLRFWVDGLGLEMTLPMHEDGRLIGCMVHGGPLAFWLNRRGDAPPAAGEFEGIRLYWTPLDLAAQRERLLALGFAVSEIVDRDYGQTECFVTDEDGHQHCFGVATSSAM